MAALAPAPTVFDVEEFLEREYAKDLLRFTTAGSVDDGKSTLIGRLLYDSQNVYEDQVRAVTKASVNRSAGAIDFSLLTDGLRAEREQGITIDVAYRYFATARRKFIIADTPGHEQYTRNMATGASTADLAIILIDARNGVLAQSRRHAYIASLLGIANFVIAVNKMDLAGYSEDVFARIRADFSAFLGSLGSAPRNYYLPISALEGDNVVRRSRNMPWFEGPSLLEYLETVPVDQPPARAQADPFRFPVQRVARPDQSFRGYAGQIASGSVRKGDVILALPSGRRSRVKSIETFDGPLDQAHAPMPVTLTLEDEIDISRGDMLASPANPPEASRVFEASVVWLNEQPLDPARQYILKHSTQQTSATIKAIRHRVNIRTLEQEQAAALEMNSIGVLEIEAARPLFFDPYRTNRVTGSFILIDPATNATAGAGMIRRSTALAPHRATLARTTTPVTAAERIARYRHQPYLLALGDRRELAYLLERKIFELGGAVTVIEGGAKESLDALLAAGLLVLTIGNNAPQTRWPDDDMEAAGEALRVLKESGILLAEESLTEGEGI